MNGMGHVAEFEGIVGWESVELKGGGAALVLTARSLEMQSHRVASAVGLPGFAIVLEIVVLESFRNRFPEIGEEPCEAMRWFLWAAGKFQLSGASSKTFKRTTPSSPKSPKMSGSKGTTCLTQDGHFWRLWM